MSYQTIDDEQMINLTRGIHQIFSPNVEMAMVSGSNVAKNKA